MRLEYTGFAVSEESEKQLREMMSLGREMADRLCELSGGEVEADRPGIDDLTPAQIIGELHGFLLVTHAQFGPALEHPMLKQMVRMMSRRKD